MKTNVSWTVNDDRTGSAVKSHIGGHRHLKKSEMFIFSLYRVGKDLKLDFNGSCIYDDSQFLFLSNIP